MKELLHKTLLIASIVCLGENLNAQSTLVSSSNELLDHNNVTSTVGNGSNVVESWYKVEDHDLNSLLSSIIISCKDSSGAVRVSGARYEEFDLYPGPVEFNSWIDESIYPQYDRLWVMKKWKVEEFILKNGQNGYQIPEEIMSYPAHNLDGTHQYFPFRDVNQDGFYNPLDGDYPEFNLDGTLGCDEPKLLGDQSILWIGNDKGGPSDGSCGGTIGINIFCQVFSYRGIESLDNATFFEYRIENQSLNQYDSVYLSAYNDWDLHCSMEQEVIASDVTRGLSYAYMVGDSSNWDYYCPERGTNTESFGIDFVKGPLAEANDGVDNDKDGTVDEIGERLTMDANVVHDRTGPVAIWTQAYGCDPSSYNIAQGYSSSGQPIQYFANSYSSRFFAPGYSDTTYWFSTGGVEPSYIWTNESVNMPLGDFSSIASLGAFSLSPGESKSIVAVMPYASASTGVGLDAADKLKLVDDTLQLFADNCFDLGCQPLLEGLDIDQLTLNKFHYAFPQLADAYSWDFGDGSSSSDPYPVHQYNAPGTYVVCLNAQNACSSVTTCDTIVVSTDMLQLGTVDIMRIEGRGNGGNELRIKESSITQMFQDDSSRMLHPIYEGDYAPIKVEVVNPYLIQSGDYQVAFDGVDSSAHWKMYKIGGMDTVHSTSPIYLGERQVISQWGVSVKPGSYALDQHMQTELLHQSKSFGFPNSDWLGGVKDADNTTKENWISAGLYDGSSIGDWTYNDRFDDENFEEIMNGALAPFHVGRYGEGQLLGRLSYSTLDPFLMKYYNRSLRLVYTQDQSRWTRCPVIETSDSLSYLELSEGYLNIKSEPSRDKNGNIESGSTGMSWFPGYAIDLETGERLNMAFGEASDLPQHNGNDMLFNPTDVMYDVNGNPVFGGRHFVFVFANDNLNSNTTVRMPFYDEGAFLAGHLDNLSSIQSEIRAFRPCSWVHMAMCNPGYISMINDVNIQANISTPYEKYDYLYSSTQNNGNPLYQFTLYPSVSVEEVIQDINASVYPNPSNGQFKFEITDPDREEMELMIFNTSGQIVKELQINDVVSEVILNEIADGLYFYYLKTKDGMKFKEGKLIKR